MRGHHHRYGPTRRFPCSDMIGWRRDETVRHNAGLWSSLKGRVVTTDHWGRSGTRPRQAFWPTQQHQQATGTDGRNVTMDPVLASCLARNRKQ